MLAAVTAGAQERITRGADKTHAVRMLTGNPGAATYAWEVTPAAGTSTSLAGVTDSTATIVWDGPPGVYTLWVSVIDGNGCLGEQISREVEILAPGDLVFAAAMPSTIICSDLAGGAEGSAEPHTQSHFQVVYEGESNLASATFTIQNPAGQYVDAAGSVLANQGSPEITVDNDGDDNAIDLAVADAWENAGSAEVQFTVTLVSVTTVDSAVIAADPETDVVRTITVLPKPVIAFD